MSRRLLYLRNQKMYYTDGSGEFELPSETLRHYIRTARESAKSKEWKNQGTGAAFLGEARGQDAETVVGNIRSSIHAAVYDKGAVFYSMTIDQSSGIYKKDPRDLSHEGIVFSDQYAELNEFSLSADRENLLYTVSEIGEKHLGLLSLATGENKRLTEGNTRDSSPCFDPNDDNRILFSSCGLAEYPRHSNTDGEKSTAPVARASHCGPAAICLLDRSTNAITQLLGDDAHDYLRPFLDSAGNLFCIRRPYQAEKSTFSLGCLTDILLFLPRLLWALVKFLSVFSTMFSGKSLTASTDVKGVKKSETDLFIDGNRIQAEEEQKRNARAGEKFPGTIPRSYELVCRKADGSVEVLAKGICAYLADGEDLYLSNGSEILKMTPDRKLEEVLKVSGVTYISAVND